MNAADAVSRRIADNLAAVRERIAASAARSGRAASAVTLVAVTKYAPFACLGPLAAAGCVDLGESRPQQLCQRAELWGDRPVRWHMIGHLQRNKARRTAEIATLIHSVDTPQLLKTLDQIGAEQSRRIAVLLEVNVSGEAAKQGFAPDDLAPLMATLPAFAHLDVRGLMAMAALDGGPAEARRDFSRLRALRDRLAAQAAAELSLPELSMGMSGDFEAAIEEGATLVRVGSALFEGVDG